MSLADWFMDKFLPHATGLKPVPQPRQPMAEIEKIAELRVGQRAEVAYAPGKKAYGIVTNWDLTMPRRCVWVQTLHDGITRAYDVKNVRVVPADVTIPVISTVTITEAEFAQ